MPVNLIAWEAAQILRMHSIAREVATVPDPHARWRDLVIRDEPTATYRRGCCGQCRDDGTCDLLDAAREYAGTVVPLLPADEVPDEMHVTWPPPAPPPR